MGRIIPYMKWKIKAMFETTNQWNVVNLFILGFHLRLPLPTVTSVIRLVALSRSRSLSRLSGHRNGHHRSPVTSSCWVPKHREAIVCFTAPGSPGERNQSWMALNIVWVCLSRSYTNGIAATLHQIIPCPSHLHGNREYEQWMTASVEDQNILCKPWDLGKPHASHDS
jgi:hypothetical protein